MNFWWDPRGYRRSNKTSRLSVMVCTPSVGDDRIYVDHGLTGTNRDRPGLRLALAACRAGDTLVVTKLDRLARSLPDARVVALFVRRSLVTFHGSSSVANNVSGVADTKA